MSSAVHYVLAILLEASVKGLVLAATGAVVLWLLRIRSVEIQHRVWLTVAMAMLLMPGVARITPSLAIPGLEQIFPASDRPPIDVGTPNATAFVEDRPEGALDEVDRTGPTRDTVQALVQGDTGEANARRIDGTMHYRVPNRNRPSLSTADASLSTAEKPVAGAGLAQEAWPGVGVAILFWIYLAGLVWMLTRFGIGLAAVHVFFRDAVPIAPQGAGATPVFESQSLRAPVTIGAFRPRIFLPPAWKSWDSSLLSAVLRHEQAHVDRWDPWANCVTELNRCFYWFHPLAWFVRSHVAWLAERCCDNEVVAATGDRPGYARHLVRIAGLLSGQSARLASVSASMARTSNVASRVDAMLNVDAPLPKQLGRGGRLSLWAATLPVIIFTASLQAETEAGGTSREQAEEQRPRPDNLEAGDDHASRLDLADKGRDAAASDQVVHAVKSDIYGDALPAGAATRLGTERFRVPDSMHNNVAFSQDGKSVVSISGPGQLRWWNAQTGELQKIMHADQLDVRASAVDPRGNMFATLGLRVHDDADQRRMEYVIQAWEMDRAKLVDEISWTQAAGDWRRLVYSPDGQEIVTTNTSGLIRVFDLATKEIVREFQLPEKAGVEALAISSDGRSLAAATGRKLFVWRWRAEAAPEEIEGFERVTAVAFSPDGHQLAVARERRDGGPMLILWDLGAAEVRREFHPPEMDAMRASDLDFSRDGKLLIVPNAYYSGATSPNAVLAWNVRTGELVHRFVPENTRPAATAISPDEKRIAAISDAEISVWSLETGERLVAGLAGHVQRVSSVRFTPDGAQVVTASDDATARVWTASTGAQLKILQHDHWIRSLAISPDGQWIATSSLDDTVRLWNAASGEEVYRLAGHGSLGGHRSVEFTRDSSRLASWGDDAYLRIWDVQTGKAVVDEHIDPRGNAAPTGDIDPYSPFATAPLEGVLAPDASALLLFTDTGTFLYNAETGKLIKKLKITGQVRQACFSADASKLLIARQSAELVVPGLDDGRQRRFSARTYEFVWIDVDEESMLWQFPIGGLYGPMAISPNGGLVAVSVRGRRQSEDHVFFLDAATGNQRQAFSTAHRFAPASNGQKMTFSPDGQSFAAGMDDTTALVWRLSDLGIAP